ncbi:uncharacterized protein RCC_02030 [Ramularia collo-cygni]|uniref:Uncharacterized protein n=1 Tax=Ramularia collo-cygni TaxID=112498 RepID=A0A2D3UQ11_9PEZI|nr:uncharacterized protein RCC_02030 [Ramularia collo-cygni]CZT16188.1 uncharacterized protein RCC_02030 [Ramularia collo-cygni]
MAGALNQRDISRKGLLIVFAFVFRNVGHEIPAELVGQVFEYLHPPKVNQWTASVPSTYQTSHPALQPPKNGRCMIEEIPTEMRRKLLGYFLPDKDVIIRPLCKQHAPWKSPTRKPQHNTVSDLMLLSKRFMEDVTACVYSERFFGIHVHEGISSGGIEFLDTGRQPLHYKASIFDDRFERFNDGEFGFNRLKKIEITIHPSIEHGHHNAMTTYYINHALVRMLERSGEKDRIVSLTINFAESAPGRAHAGRTRRQILRGEHAWWNHDLNEPRSTSIHGITDVELALRPFAMLTTVHDVRIYLPTKVKKHAKTVSFTSALEHSMKSNTAFGTLGPNDELERQAEAMRDEIESYIVRNRYGMGYDHKEAKVSRLTDQECNEVDADFDDDVICKGSKDWEGDDEVEPTAFTGPGRTLGGSNRAMATNTVTINTMQFSNKKVDGTVSRRIASVDDNVQGDSTPAPKRSIRAGVSSLGVDSLGITDDEESASKTLKRDSEDSPGGVRVQPGGDGGCSGDDSLDLAALHRDREVRRARASKWD